MCLAFVVLFCPFGSVCVYCICFVPLIVSIAFVGLVPLIVSIAFVGHVLSL